MRCGAFRPNAPAKTSPSPICDPCRRSSTPCIWIKKAAALTHRETGRLDPKLADAIIQAADEVLSGQHRDQFVVDPYQAGAGTSHNMNCNEVLANRANELLGGKRGEYKPVHPNDHVNMAQSTNDVIPTAIRLGALSLLPALTEALGRLTRACLAKGKAFDAIVKSGRTHLQDATPVRLGQEFTAYGHTVERNSARIAPSGRRSPRFGHRRHRRRDRAERGAANIPR